MNIQSWDRIEDRDQLRTLLAEYLDHEVTELHALSGLRLDTGALVEETFEDIEDYLPPRGRILVVRDPGGTLVGCAFLRRIRPDTSEIKRVYVKPSARGLGLGRRLMEQLLAQSARIGATTVLLDTGLYNAAAQALYRKLGFREIAHYREGESDERVKPYLLFMQCDLA